MTARMMDGKALAERIREKVATDVAELGDPVSLATVLVGDDPASAVYVRHKHKACSESGIKSVHHALESDTRESDLLDLISELNIDLSVTGILVQLPVPNQIREESVIRSIAPRKDVDGLHPANAGQLFQGEPTLLPATPAGIMELLLAYDVELEGTKAVVVGRSNLVGKPIAALLLQANATVTLCHSRTRNLAEVTRCADVLVAAVGRPGSITADMVKPGAIVIDVGINRMDDRLVGDVDSGVEEVAGMLTPVPGGVGPMTIAALLQNTVKAARYQSGLIEMPKGWG